MNREEFLELKDEFAQIVISYEKFLKDCIMIDYRYNVTFFELLQKIHYFEMENAMLLRAIKMQTENPEESVEEFIAKVKSDFKNSIPAFQMKNKIAHAVVEHDNTMTKEMNEDFQKIYAEFIRRNHPIVKALVTENEKKVYEKLKVYYYENNYEGFKEAYELNEKEFLEPAYEEEIYSRISQYYYDVRKNIGQDFQKKQTVYPFTKKDVFADDMSIAREESELKVHMSHLLRDNKKLHEEYTKVFGQDEKLAML